MKTRHFLVIVILASCLSVSFVARAGDSDVNKSTGTDVKTSSGTASSSRNEPKVSHDTYRHDQDRIETDKGRIHSDSPKDVEKVDSTLTGNGAHP